MGKKFSQLCKVNCELAYDTNYRFTFTPSRAAANDKSFHAANQQRLKEVHFFLDRLREIFPETKANCGYTFDTILEKYLAFTFIPKLAEDWCIFAMKF